jgi:hypothetical protein
MLALIRQAAHHTIRLWNMLASIKFKQRAIRNTTCRAFPCTSCSEMSKCTYASFPPGEGVELVCEEYRYQRVSVLCVNDEIAPHGAVSLRQTKAFALQKDRDDLVLICRVHFTAAAPTSKLRFLLNHREMYKYRSGICRACVNGSLH